MPIISKITLPDNTTYDVTDGRGMFVGSCSTAAATQTKDVSVSADQNFVLRIGAVIAVKFANTNTYKSTTTAPCKMNVNETGAKNIYWVDTSTPNNTTSAIAYGSANYYHFYVYDGSNWVWVGFSNESNTTYSGMTVAEIEAGTSTTNRLISPANLKTAVNTWIDPLMSSLRNSINRDGSHNHLQCTATSRTHNGVVFTVNSDGTITANGTASGNAYVVVGSVSITGGLFDGHHRLCGCPTGGSNTKYALYAASGNYSRYDYGQSILLTPTTITGNISVVAMVYSGTKVDNLVFKPMICHESDYTISGVNTYTQYAPTNRELYEMILNLQST